MMKKLYSKCLLLGLWRLLSEVTIATKMDGIFFFNFVLVLENFVINTSRHLASLILKMNLELQSSKIDATLQMSCGMRFPTMWYVQPAKAQTSLRTLAV